jgi:hypothetical protein
MPMGRWLNALRQAEEITKTAGDPTDETDKTPCDEVLSVLSVPPPSDSSKISGASARLHKDELTPEAETIARWHAGVTTLDANWPPTNFPAPWWRGLLRDAELFLSLWGKQAADLGWTTLDLFGAHSKAPAARFSCMGLLLLVNGGRVVAITAESAVIEQQSGARLTYPRRSAEAECVALWDLPGASLARCENTTKGDR